MGEPKCWWAAATEAPWSRANPSCSDAIQACGEEADGLQGLMVQAIRLSRRLVGNKTESDVFGDPKNPKNSLRMVG
jgi:hypothetical protein